MRYTVYRVEHPINGCGPFNCYNELDTILTFDDDLYWKISNVHDIAHSSHHSGAEKCIRNPWDEDLPFVREEHYCACPNFKRLQWVFGDYIDVLLDAGFFVYEIVVDIPSDWIARDNAIYTLDNIVSKEAINYGDFVDTCSRAEIQI